MSKSDTADCVHTRDAAIAYVLDCTNISPETSATLVDAAINADVATLAKCSQLVHVKDHPEAWLELRQVEALFKKNASFTDDRSATHSAARSFLRSELQCKRTNKRISHFCSRFPHRFAQKHPVLSSQIASMRKAIAHLLGDIGEFDRQLPSLVRLTGGATEDRARARALPFLKVSRNIRAPKSAWIIIGDLLRRLGFDEAGYIPLRFFNADHNRVEFVAKNYLTKRTIACEATHSMPLQLCFDAFAKARLRDLWSVNLSDQSRGQELARIGSIDGSFSTVDLERASDTVALLLVLMLFPREWADYLMSIRSARWSCADVAAMAIMPETGVYEKFSSMGNGSTFTIETIIFAAACIAVGSRKFAVYGDDIAIERGCVSQLLPLLRFLGFYPNAAKTFHWADHEAFVPFRESCGADWYNGRRVTPFYLRKEPSSVADFHLAVNGLVERAVPLGHVWQLSRTWVQEQCSHFVPFNTDARSGVFLDPHTAWSLGLVKTATLDRGQSLTWIPFYWALGTRTDEGRMNYGLRPYLTWFLNGIDPVATVNQDAHYYPQNPWIRPGITWLTKMSSGSVGEPRVVTLVDKGMSLSVETESIRVHYIPPLSPAPCHIYMWTDYLRRCQPGVSRVTIPWYRLEGRP